MASVTIPSSTTPASTSYSAAGHVAVPSSRRPTASEGRASQAWFDTDEDELRRGGIAATPALSVGPSEDPDEDDDELIRRTGRFSVRQSTTPAALSTAVLEDAQAASRDASPLLAAPPYMMHITSEIMHEAIVMQRGSTTPKSAKPAMAMCLSARLRSKENDVCVLLLQADLARLQEEIRADEVDAFAKRLRELHPCSFPR